MEQAKQARQSKHLRVLTVSEGNNGHMRFDSKPVLRLLAPLAFVLVVAGNRPGAHRERRKEAADGRRRSCWSTSSRPEPTGCPAPSSNAPILAFRPFQALTDKTTQNSPLWFRAPTLRVRYSAPDKARLAVLGTYSEYDIIRNGKDVWTWSSKENCHTTAP